MWNCTRLLGNMMDGRIFALQNLFICPSHGNCRHATKSIVFWWSVNFDTFWCLRFFHKINEKILTNSTMIPQIELFSFVFLEELRIPKSPFEINWPLMSMPAKANQQCGALVLGSPIIWVGSLKGFLFSFFYKWITEY